SKGPPGKNQRKEPRTVIAAVRGSRRQRQGTIQSVLLVVGRYRPRRLTPSWHRHKRKEANQSIRRSAHRGIRRLTGFRAILPWLAPAPRKVEPPGDLTGKYRSTQGRILSRKPSAPEHVSGAEGCLLRAAGSESTPLGHLIGCRRPSSFRHASNCQRTAAF